MSESTTNAVDEAMANPGGEAPAPVFTAEDYQVSAVPPSGVGVVATSVDVWSTSPEFELPSDRVDAVGELRSKLEALQRSVDTLTNRPTVDSIEPELVGASKTLRYAQQTADSILDDARAQAAELVAEAERQRSDIIRQAREQAERDYGAERDRVRSEAALWEARRAELVSEIASLSAVIGRYHDGLRALEDRLDLTVETLGNERPPAVPRPPEPDEAPAYIDLTAARANDPDAEPPAGGSVTATF